MRKRPFLVRIEWTARAPFAQNRDTTVVEREGVRILLSTAAPRVFFVQTPWLVAAGEALCAPEAAAIEVAARELVAGAGSDALPDDVLGLFAVDFARRRIVLASSISSNRAYYYAASRRGLVVSDHLAGLREAGVALELEPGVLPEYCSHRMVLPPRTLVRDVRRNVGGRVLVWPLGGPGTPEVFLWQPPAGRVREDPVARVEATLQEFLRRTAGGSRALLLSGGLDSSLVACLERARAPGTTALSSSFRWADPAEREDEYAASVADHLRVPLTRVGGSARAYLRGLVQTIHDTGEPADHLQSVMLHLLFRQYAAEGGRALLSGELADSLFGNDLHWRAWRRRRLLALLRWTGGTGAVRALGTHGRLRFFGQESGHNQTSPHHLLWSICRYTRPELVRGFFGCREEDLSGGFAALMEPYREHPLLDRITLATLFSEGAHTMTLWSRLADAQGISLLCPFSDSRLIRLLFRVPWSQKLREKKHLVRALLRRQGYPDRFLRRPKLSFGFPARCWALPGTLFQPLVDMAASEYGAPLLRRLQSLEGTRPMLLWNLLNLHLWRRLWIAGESVADLQEEILDRRREAAWR